MASNESHANGPEDWNHQDQNSYSDYAKDAESYVEEPIFLEEISPFGQKLFVYNTTTDAFHESLYNYVDGDDFESAYYQATNLKRDLIDATRTLIEEVVELEDDYHTFISVLSSIFMEDAYARDHCLETIFDDQHVSIMTDRDTINGILRPIANKYFYAHTATKQELIKELTELYTQQLNFDLQADKILIPDTKTT